MNCSIFARRGALFLIILLWIPFLASLAAEPGVSGDALYEARVEVPDRSDASRQAGIREAGLRVLSRVTGFRDPKDHPPLEPVVDELEQLVERFRIESGDNGEFSLWARFDPDSIDRRVREQGVPLWGRERPRVLVWLARRDGGDRDLLTEGDVGREAPALVQAANDRGLPLLFPIMDLEDRRTVDFADVWGGFDDRILEASGRYSPNAILIGRVENVGGDLWRSRWALYQPDGVTRWQGGVSLGDEALEDGVHELADRLARRFAVDGDIGSDDEIRLRIRGLAELEDYVRVERHLQGLTPVERVRLESLEEDTAVFRIHARGGRQSLEQAIELGDRLVRIDPTGVDGRGDAMVELRPGDALPTYRVRP
ncbi:DUF2066 domain-containing protein [Gammaproteobacteria bacterium AB-CW1]|uniref:DUF2066 domain-containing protein n=1 Tax=Natronospira elongata TaxID=3110268 RepID=A0AAP6JET2_9GAMM|nr:DUF2066 domain-containing protein [Gammaproteobacteria bacterium AB-CW1]